MADRLEAAAQADFRDLEAPRTIGLGPAGSFTDELMAQLEAKGLHVQGDPQRAPKRIYGDDFEQVKSKLLASTDGSLAVMPFYT